MYGDTKTAKDRLKKGSSKSKAIEKAKKGKDGYFRGNIEHKGKKYEITKPTINN